MNGLVGRRAVRVSSTLGGDTTQLARSANHNGILSVNETTGERPLRSEPLGVRFHAVLEFERIVTLSQDFETGS